MKVNNAGCGRPGGPPCYFCDGPDCVHPTITTPRLDEPVWEGIKVVLQDPSLIERAVERRRADGGLDRDLATLDTQLLAVVEKQARTARAIAAVDDDDAAAPLLAELPLLAERKNALQRERDDLMRRIADHEVEQARVSSLAAWCRRVSANLSELTYEGKRDALAWLGVEVRVWRAQKPATGGLPRPQWTAWVRPIGSNDPIVFSSTSGMSGTTRGRRTRSSCRRRPGRSPRPWARRPTRWRTRWSSAAC
jgi:hypothetical protein